MTLSASEAHTLSSSDDAPESGTAPQRRTRLLIAAIIAVAVPTFVADAVVVNTIGDPEARDWTVTAVSVLALGLLISVALLLRVDSRAANIEWRIARLSRRLSPSREWARIGIEALLSGVLAAAITLLVHGIVPDLPSESEAGIALATFMLVLVIAPHLVRYSRAGLYGKLDEIGKEAEGHGHGVIIEVLERNLESFGDTVRGLKSEQGLRMNRAEIIGWTIHCFANARGRYRGADGNVPSAYNARYPTYLDSHRRMLERLYRSGGRPAPSERILLATTEELRHDRVDSGKVFSGFIAWHEGRRDSGNSIPVPLFSVTPRKARELADTHGLPSTDIALWEGQYALLFIETGKDNEQVVRMCFADDNDLYARCIAYLDDLDEAKQSIDEVLNLFPEQMADAWSQYVDEPVRQEKVGAILADLLTPYQGGRVLDAAAGLGTETEWLLSHGFPDVVSNELEPQLNSRLCARLVELGVPPEHTVSNYDWRELDHRYMKGIFSVVLALGNSLCLIENTEDRLRCLEAWASVMRPGGMLVIDERNWDYFYRHRTELLEDPFEAYTAPQAMYYGTSVKSVPVAIVERAGSERIELLFYRDGHVADLSTARSAEHYIGAIDMFPIREPRLRDLLEDSGFAVVRMYSDLVESETLDPDATFYTYVAVKR